MAKKKKGTSGTRIQVIDRASGRVDKKATEQLKANNALFKAMYENQQFTLGRGTNRLVSGLAGRRIPGLGTIPMNAPVIRRHAERANRRAGRSNPFALRRNPRISFP